MEKQILVVDDDLTITNLLKECLELEGYKVIVAHNGADALSLAHSHHPDLLISDIRMPQKNGYSLVKELRQIHDFSLLPVIFLTNQDSPEDKVNGYDSGCDIFLTKPFHTPELTAIVNHLLVRAAQCAPTTLHLTGKENKENNISLDLTEREREVLSLIIKGLSNQQIAEKLYLSPKTVEKYVSTLLRVANVHNRTELAIFAYKNKIT